MSLIFDQTLKSTIYSYVGALVGMITVGYLMPKFLTPAEIGVTRQIQYYSMVFSSILSFGIPQTITRMFPYFQNKENKNYGFFTLIVGLSIIGSILFYLFFQNFGEFMVKKDLENSVLFKEYYKLIIPFTIASLLFVALDNYATAFKNASIGVLSKDLILRICILTAIGSYIYLPYITYPIFINGFTYIQFIPVIILIGYLVFKGNFLISSKFSFPSKKIKREFISVSAFSWVNALAANALISIDTIMLSKLENSTVVGIYTTIFYFSSLMIIPIRGLLKITKPIVAEHFKNNTLSAIEPIYKKSAHNPLVIALFLLGNLVLSAPIIFTIVGEEYSVGYWILVLFGLTNLINMGTGIKYIIISNSKYYRWATIFVLGFVVALIVTNLIFIPKYGMTGAAMASLISNGTFQMAGVLFVKQKFGYWPFSRPSFILTLISGGLWLSIFAIPNIWSPVPMAFIKTIIFSLLFMSYIWYFNVSPDITNQIKQRFLK